MPAHSRPEIASTFLGMCASGQVREAFERYVSMDFVHHNPYFPGDRDSLMAAMEASAASEPNKSFEVKQLLHDGDRVALVSKVTRQNSANEYAVVHVLRFDGEVIAEMWDIVQEVPSDSPNALGMF